MKRSVSLALSCMFIISGVFGGMVISSNSSKLYARKIIKTNVFTWAPTPSDNAETPIETNAASRTSDVAPKDLALKTPSAVKQGEVLPITLDVLNGNSLGNSQGLSATYLDKTIPLFSVGAHHYEGWMPVSVFQKVGIYPLTIKNKYGQTLATQMVNVANAHFSIQNITVSKSIGGLQPEPGELETVAKLKTMVTWQKFWDGDFMSPTPDCQNSPFGNLRYHNGKPTDEYHKGVDLRSPLGRPIKAINDGKVMIARKYQLHGGTVGLDHGFGFTSIFIHMSQINVQPGQMVKKGDVIGKVGSTGFATGPHLHWGFFVNGLPVNPNQWIKGVPRC